MNKRGAMENFIEKFLWIAFAIAVAIGIYFLINKLISW